MQSDIAIVDTSFWSAQNKDAASVGEGCGAAGHLSRGPSLCSCPSDTHDVGMATQLPSCSQSPQSLHAQLLPAATSEKSQVYSPQAEVDVLL